MEDTIVKYVTAKLAVSKGCEGFIGSTWVTTIITTMVY